MGRMSGAVVPSIVLDSAGNPLPSGRDLYGTVATVVGACTLPVDGFSLSACSAKNRFKSALTSTPRLANELRLLLMVDEGLITVNGTTLASDTRSRCQIPQTCV